MKKNSLSILLLVVLQTLFFSCKKTIEVKEERNQKSKSTSATLAIQTGGSINVNIGFPQQTIDLIGAGTYFYSGHVQSLSNYNTATEWLFKDLDINVFKIVLWADKVEDVNDNSSFLTLDSAGFNFTSNSNLVTQISLAKRAKLLNKNIKIWAIVLSPPKYLKTNNSTKNGGTLIQSNRNYIEFAEFVHAHLINLKKSQLDISYLSLMNEPDHPSDSVNYDSAEFTPQQAAAVYKNTAYWIRTLIDTRNINSSSIDRINQPEFVSPDCIDVLGSNNYIAPLNATGNISKFSTHQYSGSSAANFASASNLAGNKGLYMTEWHTGHGMGDNPDELTAALDLVNKFHDAFRGGAKGWMYFESGAPTNNFGGLLRTPWGATAERRKNYHVYKQYTDSLLNSRYIPTVLNGITNFGNDNVSAFTKNNEATVNVVNWNTDAQNRVRLNFGGNIKSIKIYRTSATENNALVWSEDNLNQNYYDVDYIGKSFTTVRITW